MHRQMFRRYSIFAFACLLFISVQNDYPRSPLPPPPHAEQVVDERLALMPVARDPAGRELHYRRFSNGTREMSVFTHDDFVALLQQYPYVIGRSATHSRAWKA
jgi:hypothetical protein